MGTISAWSCDPGVNGFHATNDYILGLAGEEVTEMAVAGNTMAWQHTNVYAAGALQATYDTTSVNGDFHYGETDPRSLTGLYNHVVHEVIPYLTTPH